MKNGEDLFGEFNLDDLIFTEDGQNKGDDTNKNNDEPDGDGKTPIDQQLIDIDDSNTQGDGDDTAELDGSSSSSSPTFSTIAIALGEELGIEINTEELEKAENKGQFIRDAVEKWKLEEVKKTLTEEEKEALEIIRTGVMPKAVAETKTNQRTYSSLKDEDVAENAKLQEVLIINAFITKGLSQEEAVEMYNALPEDKRKDKAVESKRFMIEREKQHEANLKATAKAEQEAKLQKTKEDLQKTESYVMSKKEYIPGLELTDGFKKEIYKAMTTTVVKDDKGNALNEVYAARAKDPVEWEFRLTTLYKLGLFNEKPDFSKFQKVAETKTARGLEKLLQESSGFMQSGKPKTASTDELGLGVFK